MGNLGGSEASKGLARLAAGKGTFAARRAALVALGQPTPPAFGGRGVLAEEYGLARTRRGGRGYVAAVAGSNPWFLSDRDGRVVAAGLQAWAATVPGPDPVLLAAARRLLGHADAGVRSVAAEVVSRAADPADLPALAAMYARTTRDSFPDAALSALKGILAIRKTVRAPRRESTGNFSRRPRRPADYLVPPVGRRELAGGGGQVGAGVPDRHGRTTQEYRDLVRSFITRTDSLARPRITIETEQRGPIQVELLGPDAPLTVANFLRLVDRHFFDGHRWHRVVPNFVAQDGDPRGDGFGGPRRRDSRRGQHESLRRSDVWHGALGPRYRRQPMVHHPERSAASRRHLHGLWPSGERNDSLLRITQGDQIRTIHR